MRSVVGSIKLEQLVLDGPSGLPNRKLEKWPFTNIPVSNVVKCRSTYLPKLSILNLKNLKSLKFHGNLEHGCEILGREMPNLEHLIFNHLSYPGSTRLCLNELRVLFLRDILEDTKLIIDCPKLTALRCNRISSIEIKHPETLIYIGSYYFEDEILNFKNLKSIHVNEAINRENILQQLPHLKLISIYTDWFLGDRILSTVRTVYNLMDEKQKLKSDVKIMFKREEIKNIEQLEKHSHVQDIYIFERRCPGDFDGYDEDVFYDGRHCPFDFDGCDS